MAKRRRRLLVSVDPPMFSDALGRILEADGVDDVVVVAPGTPVEGDFDGALVTIDLPDSVDAELVIHLPETGSGASVVSSEGHDEVIDIRDVRDVIDLLDERLAGESSRADELHRRGL